MKQETNTVEKFLRVRCNEVMNDMPNEAGEYVEITQDRLDECRERLSHAEQLIEAAMDIMTLSQVSQWQGVRAWIEAQTPTLEELGKVVINRALVEEAIKNLSYCRDDGPDSEGWQSNELKACLAKLKEVLDT